MRVLVGVDDDQALAPLRRASSMKGQRWILLPWTLAPQAEDEAGVGEILRDGCRGERRRRCVRASAPALAQMVRSSCEAPSR